MPDTRAVELIRRQERLAAERAPLEAEWREIARLVRPLRGEFAVASGSGTSRQGRAFGTTSDRMTDVYDGTAIQAADNLASGLWGSLTNSANAWFQLRHPIDELNDEQEVKLWLDAVTKRMLSALAGDGQRFYARAIELYGDLVSFGTAAFHMEEDPARGRMLYSTRHLAEIFIAENAAEEVDTVFRRFDWTARQAHQKWGDACGEPIRRIVDKEPERKFPFLHAVIPNAEWDPKKSDRRGKPWASVHVDIEGRTILSESGYHEMPYAVPRWSTMSRGVYGDSPAALALPDIRMMQAMDKTVLKGAQKVVDPVLLATDELAVRGVGKDPGAILYGGLDEQGRPLLHPLTSGGRIDLGHQLTEQRRVAVREAFYASLLVMVQTPQMTATEWLGRQEEKMRQMGPHFGRLQAEFLDPVIDRLFAVMSRGGAFPPPPPILLQYPDLKVEYVSPLARAQRAGDASTIMRTIEAVGSLAGADPAVFDNFDLDQVSRGLADGFGLPPAMMRDPRKVAEMRQGRARQQQQAAMAQMAGPAQQAAGAVKALAEAGAMQGNDSDQAGTP